MSIVLTNSLNLDINKPLVTKDIINSDIDYNSQNPLELTEEELLLVNSKYNVGYIVYDNYTKLHYKWTGLEKGWELLQDNYEEYVEEVIDSLDSVGTGVSSSGNISVTVRQIEGTIDSVIVEEQLTEFFNKKITETIKNTLNHMDSAATGVSDNVSVDVYQCDGLITKVVVTDSLGNITEKLNKVTDVVNNLLNELDSTVSDSTNNVDIEIIQENGKITGVNVTDRTEEAINNTINNTLRSLDSTVSDSTTNLEIELTQVDGLVKSVEIIDKGLPKKLVLTNPELSFIEDKYTWIIPYNQLIENGIDIDTAVVFIREINTGKQLVADIIFDDNNSNLLIYFDGNEITANIYKAIILS